MKAGNLPMVSLADIAEIVTGTTPSTAVPKYYVGSIPFVTPTELDQTEPICKSRAYLSVDGAAQARLLPVNAVMVCCIGSLGKLGIAGVPLVTNQQINSLVVNPSLADPKYVLHACRLLRPVLELIAPSTTVKIVNKSRFSELQIPLPPLEEQRRIAAILDKADELRQKRRAALQKLDSLTRSIFLDMFGDPAHNAKDFRTYRLGDLAVRFSDGPFGSNLKSEHYEESGVRVIRLQNIGVGEFINDDLAFISEAHAQSLRKHECLSGDVLVGTMGDPNLRACIQPEWLTKAINKADCVQVRVNRDYASSEWLCTLLNSPSVEKMAGGLILGQTRSRIAMGRLRELIVPVPPIAQQLEFSKRYNSLKEMEARDLRASDGIMDLAISLQHRAFQGEL